ncbi:Unconventional myosin-XVIIIb [Aix galericulata]|nr:Unconventional myosin-XVIIIb [Aix galericulata]
MGAWKKAGGALCCGGLGSGPAGPCGSTRSQQLLGPLQPPWVHLASRWVQPPCASLRGSLATCTAPARAERGWQIREEDRAPPPSAPPLLLSVIPGGFIKQLVRETEKESKEARLKKKAKATAKEDGFVHTPWPGRILPLPLPFRTLLRLLSFSWQPPGEAGGGRAGDTPAAGGAAASKGQPLQNGLHTEGQGGEGAPAPPGTALPPGRAAPGPGPCKAPAPTPSPAETPHPGAPEAAKPSLCPEKSPKDAHPGGSPPAPDPAPSKSCSKGPVKEGDALKGKGPEGSKKEEKGAPESSKKEKGAPERSKKKGEPERSKGKGAPESSTKEKGAPAIREGPTAKGRTKRELALAKEPEKMKKDAGGGKKEAREIKGPGKTTNKAEGPKGEPGGIQGKAEDGAKEAGKAKDKSGKSKEAPEGNKEAPGESKEASMESKEEMADSTDQDQAPRDVWYEAEKVWLLQRDGFTLATQLKPDVGTPELPAGRVRLRLEADGSVAEVDEDSVQRSNPPGLDLAEDLASLISLNECSALNTLRQRLRAQLPYTYAGPSLLALGGGHNAASRAAKVLKGRRDGMPPHLCSMAQRAYGALLAQRQDQAILPLGRSGAGRTACCQGALEYLVGTAGSVDGTVSGTGPVGRRPPGLRVPFGSRSLQICYFDKPQSKHREGMTCLLWAALLPCDQVTNEVRGSDQLEGSSGLRGPGGLRARHTPAKGWRSPSCRHKSCPGAGWVMVCAGGAGGAASRRSCPRRLLSGCWCWVSVEKIQAMFTVLGAFGSVTTSHSSSSTRFSMVLSLDFSATGRITAAHLQVPTGPAASSRDGDRAGAALRGEPRRELLRCQGGEEERCSALLPLHQGCPRITLSRSAARGFAGPPAPATTSMGREHRMGAK